MSKLKPLDPIMPEVIIMADRKRPTKPLPPDPYAGEK